MTSLTLLTFFLCLCARVAQSGPTNTSETLNATHVIEESPLDAGTQGRSMLSDLPRQGRIINDDKISIKGFIPIVGLGAESTKETSKDHNDQEAMDKYLKSLAALTA